MYKIYRYIINVTLLLALPLFTPHAAFFGCRAQAVLDIIRKTPSFAACNYNIYPDTTYRLTPAPAGKKPFYISHYGRHGSRYINSRRGYDIPYAMMQQAANVDELTPIGKKVFEEMKLVLESSEGRWGELSARGRHQQQTIARHMMQNFPEVFQGSATVRAISTIVPRCIVSMGAAILELTQGNPELQVTMEASRRTMHYMNHQDPFMRHTATSQEAKEAFDKFMNRRTGNSRLMDLIFKNPDIISDLVDETNFSYYLMKMGLFQLNTHLYKNTYLLDIFRPEELYHMWQIDNALWYVQYASCPINDGGYYPYVQRHLLRQIIADADSCIRLPKPGAQLRFGHETVLLPLICLIGINGYGLRTSNLDEIEAKGWWSSSVFPMAGNLQFVFYRSSPSDKDILFKVLLNEQEARLPIATDCAPYYHWRDFRRHYLKMINRYEKERNKTKK